ncbi:MAG: hypothetical protein IPO81_29160 [Kouleothrix sp.]|nr:hypothetical protein [Kouleothrix sp.]
MKRYRATAPLLAGLVALAIAAIALNAYRDLLGRPFAADDYQWLLAVRGLSAGQVVQRAFDAGAQSHFYRPLVWLLVWAQWWMFDLEPAGYHVVSLALHLLNAALAGLLAYRLQIADCRLQIEHGAPQSTIYKLQSTIPIVAMAIVALHPAPFEAVTWISAQSELLAAALLLAALHLWLPKRGDKQTSRQGDQAHTLMASLSPGLLVSTLAYGLALLAKESAVIGLPLLILAGCPNAQTFKRSNVQHLARYLLPTLITLAYVALQISVERRNYLLRQGGYGLGPQLVLNPLRSLALVVAPLPGSEHADAAWLVPVGAIVALILLAWLALNVRFMIGVRQSQSQPTIYNPQSAIILALGLTLLPTAPFASPPDSRYLYLPVIAAALLLACTMYDVRRTIGSRPLIINRQSKIVHWSLVAGRWSLVVGLAWWSAGELRAREGRFAAGAGPGGSLWRLATSVCAEGQPERMVVVEPPLATPHAEAIVALSCGSDVKALVVGRDQVARAAKGRAVVVEFPNGSAQVTRRTR